MRWSMRRRQSKKRFGDLLIEKGVIEQMHVDHILKMQQDAKEKLLSGKIFMDLDLINEEHVTEMVSTQYNMPFMWVDNYDINPEALAAVTEDLCREKDLIPIDKFGNMLVVAMSNPLDHETIQHIRLTTMCDVQTVISTDSAIMRAIEKHFCGKRSEELVAA